MRRIIVSIATSADGFIARRDVSVDWLDRPRRRAATAWVVRLHDTPI